MKNVKMSNNISDNYNIKKLKIKAVDAKDIKILSSLCQDGIFTINEMRYLEAEETFVATFSRFCWEFKGNENSIFYRVVSGIQISEANNLKFINFNKEDKKDYLNLLAITLENKSLLLKFSNSKLIRLGVNKINILLDDIDIPWPTGNKPEHK